MPDTTRLVLVAIPRNDDHVWEISSQKVPHMTLLYLDEVDWTYDQIRNVAEFVEHASSLINRFGMSVDKRDLLGDEDADVLYFETRGPGYKDMVEFRSGILSNDTIRAAYHSTEQFAEWTPHLTLGYPDSPANEDDRDYPIYWVQFDKIALWTEEFDGFTYELKEQDYEGLDVAMSGLPESPTPEDILEHYGVKGMKWGVRRSGKKGSTSRTTFKKPPSKLSNEELARRIQRMQTEKKYNELNKPDLTDGQKLAKEILTNSGRKVATGALTAGGALVVKKVLDRV